MILILVGFASLLAQVVQLREIGVAFYDGETVYVLGPAIWLLVLAGSGIAAGALDDALVHAGADPTGEEFVHLAATRRDSLGRVLLPVPFSGLPTNALTVAALAFPAALAVWPLKSGPFLKLTAKARFRRGR